MVVVPTQTFVVNFLGGVILSSYWLFVTYKTINELIWLAEDPSNFVEVQEKDEADETD